MPPAIPPESSGFVPMAPGPSNSATTRRIFSSVLTVAVSCASSDPPMSRPRFKMAWLPHAKQFDVLL